MNICDNIGMVIDPSYFLKCIAIVDINEMNTTLLSTTFLSRISSSQKLTTITEFQTANTSDQYLSEVPQLILQYMVDS